MPALTVSGTTTVLLVESHDDSRDMYADHLRSCGFTVQTAITTDEALMRARNADVIVTEIRVRGSFDGVGLVGRLRADGETNGTPIIVLTACAFDTDRKRARAAGCNVFLSKPCLPDRLVTEVGGISHTGSFMLINSAYGQRQIRFEHAVALVSLLRYLGRAAMLPAFCFYARCPIRRSRYAIPARQRTDAGRPFRGSDSCIPKAGCGGAGQSRVCS